MITANELRIGNYVFELEYLKVKSISETGINADANGVNYPFDMLVGIPLTTEILEKCGFEMEMVDSGFGDIDEKIFYKNGVTIFDNTENGGGLDYATYTRYKDRGYKSGITIHSIHQLQNLYFSLAGEELTINL